MNFKNAQLEAKHSATYLGPHLEDFVSFKTN